MPYLCAMNGEKILHYRIDQPAYENALFRYFVGTHTTFSKQVLIKTLKSPLNQEERQAFATETRQFARLQHPTLTTLYDYMESEQEIYAVLDYQKGTTLADYIHLQHGLLPEAQAISTLLQLLEVWEVAHKAGVFGGVIRPNYIQLTPEYTLKVQDLALSKFYAQKMMQLGDKDNMCRLAPEYWQHNTPIDARADIYGLGLLFFELLTAKTPFDGLTINEIRAKVLDGVLPSPKQYYALISPATEEIVRKATAQNPIDRYQSCAEMRQALLDWKPAPAELPKETKEKSPIPKKQQKPSFDISKYDTINIAPWLLLCSCLILGLLAWRYAGNQKSKVPEVVANIQDEGRVRSFQDSIAKAQFKKAIDDSIKRTKAIANKQVIAEPYMHRVRVGESLERIARRYYVTLDSLKKLNNMTGKEVLKAKLGIKIPVKAVYHMKLDETLEMVGQKFNVNPLVLKEVNQIYPKPPKAGQLPEPLIFEGKEVIVPLMMPAKK